MWRDYYQCLVELWTWYVSKNIYILITFCHPNESSKNRTGSEFHETWASTLSTHICRWRRLCQTAFSSGVGALNTITRLLGRLWGLQPPLLLTSTWPFSEFPAGLMAICNRNSVGLFRTVKQASAILDNRRGSSVTNKTRSRETRANTSRSVRSRAQEGCSRARPSTFASAPPNSLKHYILYVILIRNIIYCI